MRIVVGASSFNADAPVIAKLFAKYSIECVTNPYGRRLTEDEIIEHLKDADGLLAGLEPLTEKVFQQSPKLKAIARIGIGTDNVDFEAAKRHGIKVSNTPDGPTDAVAEMTLTALLALNHHLVDSNADVHNGVWKKRMGVSIRGQKVFIIGMGRIGKKVAALLGGLGVEILAYDKYNEAASTCTLEEGLAAADAVTLHVSGNEEVLGAAELDKMRPGAVLLNSARGKVVNEDALCERLRDGRIGGFWGDALWQEPYDGKLRGCENAILTPHICTYSADCRESMETDAVRNLLRDLGIE